MYFVFHACPHSLIWLLQNTSYIFYVYHKFAEKGTQFQLRNDPAHGVHTQILLPILLFLMAGIYQLYLSSLDNCHFYHIGRS